LPAEPEIAVEDPRAEDIRTLLRVHVEWARAQTPPEDAHALDLDGLLDPAVTFFALRREGTLLAIGALKRLDDAHFELKSMHTVASARGTGLGRAMLERLLSVASQRGATRVSLETGAQPAFEPARSLYASAGFVDCEPFAQYIQSANSTFMTRTVTASSTTRR
jgi:putative acetyltransferase